MVSSGQPTKAGPDKCVTPRATTSVRELQSAVKANGLTSTTPAGSVMRLTVAANAVSEMPANAVIVVPETSGGTTSTPSAGRVPETELNTPPGLTVNVKLLRHHVARVSSSLLAKGGMGSTGAEKGTKLRCSGAGGVVTFSG